MAGKNMINKTFFQVIALWLVAIVCLSVMDTIIFHQENMIFLGEYFLYPETYKGLFGDAWHMAKLFMLLSMFSCVMVAWSNEKKLSVMQIIFYLVIFGGLTGLIHWVMFHNLLIK